MIDNEGIGGVTMVLTSYYNNPQVREIEVQDKISISRYQPKYLDVKFKTCPKLYPSSYMMRSFKEV